MCQTGLEKTVMLSFTVQQITTNLDYRTKKSRLKNAATSLQLQLTLVVMAEIAGADAGYQRESAPRLYPHKSG